MALEYSDNQKFEELAPVLEDYTYWYAEIAFLVAYPDQNDDQLKTPESYYAWLDKVSDKKDISSSVLNDITNVHDKMIVESQKVLAAATHNTKPDVQLFTGFKALYSSFLSRIRRLEKDSALEGSGIDEETGLRLAKSIEGDVKREMERLARQGTPFSLVLTRIDSYAGQPDQKAALKLAVENIELSMRPFDDAYYLGNGCFLLNLKQADIIGAESAINRFRYHLANSGNEERVMTMSYCMVEPSDGDDTDNLIKKMQQDLNEHLNAKDAVLKFKEISELERFVGTVN